MKFFFYGSLLDPAIRRVVMGPGAQACRLVPAALDGWRRCRWQHAIYPVLLRQPGGIVDGCLVEPVAAPAAARLAAFEGRAYRAVVVPVRVAGGIVNAHVFLPSRRRASPMPWILAAWLRGQQRRALRLAQAQMARDGRRAMGPRLIAWRRRARQAAGDDAKYDASAK